MSEDMKATLDRMKLQSDEFDAMAELAKQYRRITLTPVVDDDYPEVRHDYESALATFLEKMKANGRFEKGNRYRLLDAIKVSGERSDAAVIGGEHAFKAGYDSAAQRAVNFHPTKVTDWTAHKEQAWSDYDPPEDIKALA